MSYSNRFSGEITITPPLTWSEIRAIDSGVPRITDVRLRIDEERTVSDDGNEETVRRTAGAIVPLDMTYSGSNVTEDVQAIVDHYGPLGHSFTGWIQVQWDAGFDDPIPQWYIVRDGRVVAVKPRLLWPGDAVRSAHGDGI